MHPRTGATLVRFGRVVVSPVGRPSRVWARPMRLLAQVGAGHLGRVSWAACEVLAHDTFLVFKSLIHFQKQFKSSLNFQNLYQIQFLSKILETSSVGFVISISIHEKCQTQQ
jgi:hypothetical protein